jgi:hypothetical protein
MQVETYEVEEINSSEAATMAADSTAIELINSLGLTGQQSLINPDTETRFPYPTLTPQQNLVFKTLFPNTTEVKKYSNEILPLRVLQVIAHCKGFPQTSYLEIWHAGSVKKDPVLLGRADPYSGTVYLLARWGTALVPFERLMEQARPILTAQANKAIRDGQMKLKQAQDDLHDTITEALSTGTMPSFSVYV